MLMRYMKNWILGLLEFLSDIEQANRQLCYSCIGKSVSKRLNQLNIFKFMLKLPCLLKCVGHGGCQAATIQLTDDSESPLICDMYERNQIDSNGTVDEAWLAGVIQPNYADCCQLNEKQPLSEVWTCKGKSNTGKSVEL